MTAESIDAIFSRCRPAFAARLRDLSRYRDDFARFGGEAPAPRFEQDWFPRLDAAMAYALVRERRPPRIVEIGSGHSSRVMARAIIDGNLPVDFVTIDPQPRAPLAGLPVRHVNSRLQETPADIFSRAAGRRHPVHRFQPHTDARHRRGIADDADPAGGSGGNPRAYPRHLPARRLSRILDLADYNEQSAVAALCQDGGWAPLFASRYRGCRGWPASSRKALRPACRCSPARSKAACGWTRKALNRPAICRDRRRRAGRRRGN